MSDYDNQLWVSNDESLWVGSDDYIWIPYVSGDGTVTFIMSNIKYIFVACSS